MTQPSSSSSKSSSHLPHKQSNGESLERQGMDSAERERTLAEQLRKRALASKSGGRQASRSPPLHRASRSASRSPPSRRSASPSSSIRSRSRTRSPIRTSSRRSDHRSSRRRDQDREEQRRRRRSGRENNDSEGSEVEGEDRYRHNRRRRCDYDDLGDGGDRDRRSITRGSRPPRSNHPDEIEHDANETDDDKRSVRSSYSRRHRRNDSGHRQTPSREYHDRRRDRDPYNDRPPRRGYEYDSYYRRPHAAPSSYDYYSPSYYGHDRRSRRRSPSPRRRSPSPEADDYERRSIFCSQLAARMTTRDLGEFFEEKLGDGAVKDVRIVSDKITGRSKGIGYVELQTEELVQKAIALSGHIIYGIPILVQLTEAARNRGEGASTAAAPIRPNLPGLDPSAAAKLPVPPHLANAAGQVAPGHRNASYHPNTEARLYVGRLHFSLTDVDVKAIFEPFGQIDDVDLHREPTGKSKGFAFVQFRSAEDAEKAIEHMNGFELAGLNIRVGHVNARGQEGKTSAQLKQLGGDQAAGAGAPAQTIQAAAALSAAVDSGSGATLTTAFDEGGGGGLNAHSRANLMQMLSRSDQQSKEATSASDSHVEQIRPASIPEAKSKAVLLKNMFNPEEETDNDWDKDLAEDVKGECQSKYGKVEVCIVDKDSVYGEIYLSFTDVSGASQAIAGLNGRWFGGRQVSAAFISESFLAARFG